MSKSENETNTISLSLGLNILDKALEFTWALGFTYFLLFFDISSIILFDKGIFHWTSSNIPTLSFGHIGIVIVIVSLFSSFFLPIITLQFTSALISFHCKFFNNKEVGSYNIPYDYVEISKLRDYALSDNSNFLYQIYLDENIKYKRKQAELLKLEYISFGIFTLFLLDWWLSSSNGESKSFVDCIWTISMHFDENASHGLVSFIVSFLIFIFYYFVCLPREENRYVYNPLLYNKIEKRTEHKED